MKVWLQDHSWEEVKEKIDSGMDLAIIPVSGTERHRRHLPLGTDTMVAAFLAEDGARKTRLHCGAPLWYGWAPPHGPSGTVTVRPEVLAELLYDVIQSLHEHGFKKMVVINGHRIVNIPWMQIAAERAQRLLGVKVVLFDPAYMSKEIVPSLGFGPVGHAEEIETSHMMYKRPDLVWLEKAEDNPHKPAPLYSVDPAYAKDTLCYVPSTRQAMQKQADASGVRLAGPPSATGRPGKIPQASLGQPYGGN